MRFPNLAGCDGACLIKIPAELALARIECYDFTPKPDFRSEVPYRHFGFLSGWIFRRAWYYWVVHRHDNIVLPFAYTDPLDEKHKKDVRASGDCACRGARFWYPEDEGHLGAGCYHVDTQPGLNALADAIRLWTAERAPKAGAGFKNEDLKLLGKMGWEL